MSDALRIAIRVDASTVTGLGHLRRCISLARALRDAGAKVRLIARDHDIDVASIFAAEGLNGTLLPRPSPSDMPIDAALPAHARWAGVDPALDAAQTVERLAAFGPHWVIVDHYALDARWHRAVAANLHARIAVIDDLADRDLETSLLVDHNYAIDPRGRYAGRVAKGTRMLLGPRFALLGAAYAEAQRYVFREQVHSIGIFMGGVDAAGASAMALRACRHHAGFDGPIEIATTSANPQLANLRRIAEADGTASVLVDASDLAAFYARHDLHVGAAGGAVWERCCIGAPTLVLDFTVNQRAVMPGLAAAGVAATLPVETVIEATSVGREIAALIADPARRRAMSEASRRAVDGLGARRVALTLARSTLVVRPARREDAERLHCWRNDPVTRCFSHDSREIDWHDHVAWLERVLKDPERVLLVGAVGAIPVGAIRFDRRSNAQAEVSLYLDPALHGLGLGGELLRAGEAVVGAPTTVLAKVVQGNTASDRMFESAGYQRVTGGWLKNLSQPPSKETT